MALRWGGLGLEALLRLQVFELFGGQGLHIEGLGFTVGRDPAS